MRLNIVKLGKMDYSEALKIQERLLERRQKGEINDTLLLVEHPPVLTIGIRGNDSNILISREILGQNGVNIYEVNRGGDVTYHGPGQIVGYPIFDLNGHGRDVKEFVFKLENVFIELLKNEYGIEAYRQENKYTGVWVGDEKITAIGIAVKRWVTMHGFAFNVNTNLDHFKWIIPCGITDKGVTSLQKLLGHPLDFEELNDKVAEYFCKVFGMKPEAREISDLM
ncbi:MAG TPA: lipoyl(octanoyl) transferase LipB [Clostridiaceae bacterium]|nr:lipoyl(octanoyl) transferase LipB [Clostridiaceae bacterium]